MDTTNVPPIVGNQDEEHLRLLATFHYVVAGLGALFACMPLMHVAMGVMMHTDPSFMGGGKSAPPQPAFIGSRYQRSIAGHSPTLARHGTWESDECLILKAYPLRGLRRLSLRVILLP